MWSFKPDVRPFTYKGHRGPVTCVEFNSKGNLVVSCSKDGTVKLWPNKVKPKFRTVKAHSGPVRCVEFSPDDNYVLSTGDDKSAKVWRTGNLKF